MRKGIFALLIMLLAGPALARDNQDSELSENEIVIETNAHSDQESLASILNEAGVDLDADILEALKGGGAKIKIIKHSRTGDDADPSNNKKVFVTRSKGNDHPLMPSSGSMNIDQLDVEVITDRDKDIFLIKGLGGPSEHAERLFIEDLHEAPGRRPGGMHWFEDSRVEHHKQNLTGDAAQCVIKNLTKVTSPMAAKLLREACISLHEE